MAAQLKRTLGVPNGWIAERLNMGSAIDVRKHVGMARRGHPAQKYLHRIQTQKVKGKG